MSFPLLDTLDWGTRLEGNVITYAFYQEGVQVELDEDEDGDAVMRTMAGWTEYEKHQARLAFDSFARLTNLSFVEADSTDTATLRLALYDFDNPGSLGWAVPPGEEILGQPPGFAAFNVGSPMWSREVGGNLDVGGYGFITLTHEFGHLLGLAHPHDSGGGSPIMPGVVQDENYYPAGSYGFYDLNQGVHTMMSYRDGWDGGPVPKGDTTTPYGWSTGPMALDIAILQQKYGTNGDPGQAGTVYDLLDTPTSGYGYTAIWNPAGGHTIRYQGEHDAVINLLPATLEVEWGGGGWLSFVKGIIGGYTIAHGIEVLNAISGSGNDTLIGNALDNTFDAGLGTNSLYGNGGADVVLYDGSIYDYGTDWLDDAGAWGVAAADESRTDILYGIRLLEFNEGRVAVEAVAEDALAVGGLYLAMLDRLPDAEGYGYWTKAMFAEGSLAPVASLLTGSGEFAAGLGALSDAEYINWIYSTLLDREADQAGATYWAGELAVGMDRGALALQFLSAEEQSDSYHEAVIGEVLTFGDLWAFA